MSDLVSRQAVIDYLMINMVWQDEDGYDVDDWSEKLPIITDLINGVPTGWISVKDRLPEESGNVLVCIKLSYANGARHVQMCHYSVYHKWFGGFDKSEKSSLPDYTTVTHWMPLPSLPEEESHD